MSMNISRQTDRTQITELHGSCCEALVGVGAEDGLTRGYIKARRGWFRFFIDEGVLFFEASSGSPFNEDLDADEQLIAILSEGKPDRNIQLLEFQDGLLRLVLTTGVEIRFREDTNSGLISYIVDRPAPSVA